MCCSRCHPVDNPRHEELITAAVLPCEIVSRCVDFESKALMLEHIIAWLGSLCLFARAEARFNPIGVIRRLARTAISHCARFDT
jgi:hypothetical protein